MFEKASRVQDSKNRITPPGSPFLERTSFYVFEIDFCCVAVRKSIICGVYWLQLVIMEITKLKNVRKSKPYTRS